MSQLNLSIVSHKIFDLIQSIATELPKLDENDPDIKEKRYLLLLYSKFFNNLSSSCILVAHGQYQDCRILIRSAYETIVLTAYLITYPLYWQDYIADNEINDYRAYLELIKTGIEKVDEKFVLHYYSSFSKQAKQKIKIPEDKKAYYLKNPRNFWEKIKKFFENYKPLAQRNRHMYEKIVANDIMRLELETIQWWLYNTNSGVAHGNYEATHKYLQQSTKEPSLKDLHEVCRQLIWLNELLLRIWKYRYGIQPPQNYRNEVIIFMEFIGIDFSRLRDVEIGSSSLLYLPIEYIQNLNNLSNINRMQ